MGDFACVASQSTQMGEQTALSPSRRVMERHNPPPVRRSVRRLVQRRAMSHCKSPDSAKMPKTNNSTPEKRFIALSTSGVTLPRNRLTPKAKIDHHSIDPVKTPTTSNAAAELPLVPVNPIPAKRAAKERIVTGLVMVRNSVERYAGPSPLLPTVVTSSEGTAKNITNAQKTQIHTADQAQPLTLIKKRT